MKEYYIKEPLLKDTIFLHDSLSVYKLNQGRLATIITYDKKLNIKNVSLSYDYTARKEIYKKPFSSLTEAIITKVLMMSALYNKMDKDKHKYLIEKLSYLEDLVKYIESKYPEYII